jgi:transposase-like protein
MPRRGKRDHRKERYWRQQLRRWKRSRLTIRAFCTEHGLAEASFYFWRQAIAQRDHESNARHVPVHDGPAADLPAFVPVRVVPPVEAASFEVVLGPGRVVRVPPGFDTATLRQLLAVLKEPSC